jgi:Double-stranded RNA binding motif
MFNYQNALRNLSSEMDVEIGQDAQQSLHQAIGVLHRIKPADNYKDIVERYLVPEMLAIDLQYFASSPSFSQSGIAISRDSSESSPPPYSITRGVELQATQSQSTSCSDIEIWRYTSRLWEEGTLFGQLPIVKNKMLRSIPPLFKVTVDFKGTRGEGEASNKKQAKHIASKDICDKLGIIL